MAETNITEGGTQTTTLEVLLCSSTLTSGIHQQLIFLSVVDIFLSITAFLGNILIFVALRKESSLHPPSKLLYRCLATTHICVGLVTQPVAATYWMSLVHKDWSLCRYTSAANSITCYTLSSVSLMTVTAISVDRLLALSLGLRYRQVVTVKRTYAVIATFWVVSGVAAALYLVDHRITFWYGRIAIPLCLGTSITSYTKIFRALRHQHTQVQDHTQQQHSHQIPLNIARYRKARYSALWVQLALVACYLPYLIVSVLAGKMRPSSLLFLTWRVTALLVYFNSSLNPFLYCWKISEVRQAVKETIRQALCCPST